jgi:hypothetical protein
MKRILVIIVGFFCVTIHAVADRVAYQVPTNDESLTRYTTFEVNASCIVQDNQVQLQFTLPPELTGDQTTTLTFAGQLGATDSTVVTGPNGILNCGADSCASVNYLNLAIDLNNVDAYLRATAESSVELNARTKVAQLFSGDPGGVLSYSLNDCQDAGDDE